MVMGKTTSHRSGKNGNGSKSQDMVLIGEAYGHALTLGHPARTDSFSAHQSIRIFAGKLMVQSAVASLGSAPKILL